MSESEQDRSYRVFGQQKARESVFIITGILPERLHSLIKNFLVKNDKFQDVSETPFIRYEKNLDIVRAALKQNTNGSPAEEDSEELSCSRPFLIYKSETLEAWIQEKTGRNHDNEEDYVNKSRYSRNRVILMNELFFDSNILKDLADMKRKDPETFNYVVICFLVTSDTLFKNAIDDGETLGYYNDTLIDSYENFRDNLFRQYNESEDLRAHTILLELTNDFISIQKIESLFSGLFREENHDYSLENARLQRYLSKSTLEKKTAKNVATIRRQLRDDYEQNISSFISSTLAQLKDIETSEKAARNIIQLVWKDLMTFSDEQCRFWKRSLLIGLNSRDSQNHNTVVGQLAISALRLLNNNDRHEIPLIYEISETISKLTKHPIFRYQVFNHNPAIFNLSLFLITQKQHMLTWTGLKLCRSILVADIHDHKYALKYHEIDNNAGKKVFDAINWLLEPILNLSKIPESTSAASLEASENDEYLDEYITLLKSIQFDELSSLYHGSSETSGQVKTEDVEKFINVIDTLVDRVVSTDRSTNNRINFSIQLVQSLCQLLSPILLLGSRDVNELIRADKSLPEAIHRVLLMSRDNRYKNSAHKCLQVYNKIMKLKIEGMYMRIYEDSANETEEETAETTSVEKVDININETHVRDIMKEYYVLREKFSALKKYNLNSSKHEEVNQMFKRECETLNSFQIKYEYEKLQQDFVEVNKQLVEYKEKLSLLEIAKDQMEKRIAEMNEEIAKAQMTVHRGDIPIVSSDGKTLTTTSSNTPSDDNLDELLEQLSPEAINADQAKQYIKSIYHRRVTFNEPDMKKSICGSLKQLGSDLYSSSVHFLHELIQNAEDNYYKEAVTPCLRIRINPKYIMLSNNEQGLRTKDVSAICSLAVSTKTKEQKHLGEKGVGFKSVFAASNQPMLFSHNWKFYFDATAEDEMKYITPIWLEDDKIYEPIVEHLKGYPEDTHLYLPLKSSLRPTDAQSFLETVNNAIDPCILLSMKKLKQIEVYDEREDKMTIMHKEETSKTKLQMLDDFSFGNFTFMELTGDVIELRTSTTSEHFRVYNCYSEIQSALDLGRNKKTQLTLIFPCSKNFVPNANIYTGLPVCDLGLKFMVNADFKLVTSRENVRENVTFNCDIRDRLGALFVYILLNDEELKKDMSRYCPPALVSQTNISHWWKSLLYRINKLIDQNITSLLGFTSGKQVRRSNPTLEQLVSKDELDRFANIRIIDPDHEFFNKERLITYNIKPVSMTDVLDCFPSQGDENNREFYLQSLTKDETWWSNLFECLCKETEIEAISERMRCKPIFTSELSQKRDYFPKSADGSKLLIFIREDQSKRNWKKNLTIVNYQTDFEREALLRYMPIQLLNEERLIELILQNHSQLHQSNLRITSDDPLNQELWNDLDYLRFRLEKFDNSKPLLVPVQGPSSPALISATTFPYVLGLRVKLFIRDRPYPFIQLPYLHNDSDKLLDILRWEYFLLSIGSHPPSIKLKKNFSITDLPMLNIFGKTQIDEYGIFGEFILSKQTPATLQSLSNFPVAAQLSNQEKLVQISATFDKTFESSPSYLPLINIQPSCRKFASLLGVHIQCDIRSCQTVLSILSSEHHKNIDTYIDWLHQLQKELKRTAAGIDYDDLRKKCTIYLSEEDQFCTLDELLILSDTDEKYEDAIATICKYLGLKVVSYKRNRMYSLVTDLFRITKCRVALSIIDVCRGISLASKDGGNFYSVGSGHELLTNIAHESMVELFQYLESIIYRRIEEMGIEHPLYRLIISEKPKHTPIRSAEALEWRFKLFKDVSLKNSEIRKDITKSLSCIPGMGWQMIEITSENIIFACFEATIIKNLLKIFTAYSFISPMIVQACPVVLSMLQIDYIERVSQIHWHHKNNNPEKHHSALTDIFQKVLGDENIQVESSFYLTIDLSLIFFESSNDNTGFGKLLTMWNDLEFMIFKSTVLLCTGVSNNEDNIAKIAVSALATLLHHRKNMLYHEAVNYARDSIISCTEFRSIQFSNLASTDDNVYSCTDVIFPFKHDATEINISISHPCTIETDEMDVDNSARQQTRSINPERREIDEKYKLRVQNIDHSRRSTNLSQNPPSVKIVDADRKDAIALNAEQFFYNYLEKLYGGNISPISNWVSANRLKVFPSQRSKINDAAGYDFCVDDISEKFVKGNRGNTKTCYFEVKGASGFYYPGETIFFISQNEYNFCRSIADSSRRNNNAYFIVIIESCLNPENTGFGQIICWSDDIEQIRGEPDSYKCTVDQDYRSNLIGDMSERRRNQQRQEPNWRNQQDRSYQEPNWRNRQDQPYQEPNWRNQQPHPNQEQ